MMKRFLLLSASRVICRTLPGLIALTIAGAGAGPAASAQIPALVRPTAQIKLAVDETQLVTLPGALSPRIASAQEQGVAPDSLAIGRVMLMLRRTKAQQAALDKLVDDQQNTRSASYHHWLTPEQFGQNFGADPSDIQKLTAWLQTHGFTVEPPMAGHSLLVFSGTHAQMKSAFHTEFHSYKLKGMSYWAAAGEPQIPAALAPAVIGFTSLNNFPRRAMHTKPKIVHRGNSSWEQVSAQTANTIMGKTGSPVDGGGPRSLFTTDQNGATQTLYMVGPSDLATLYNIQPLWDAGIDGTGQLIAIVSDSDINPSDVDDFRSIFGLPAKKLNVLYYGPNPGRSGDEDEAVLDVEWAGAVAKNATIDLVVAANTAASGGIDGAAAYIINNNVAPLLNVSYGACEQLLGTAGNQYYSLLWEQAAAQGITVLAAAGDSGSDVCDENQGFSQTGLSVSGLASTAYNVAVGGTDFALGYNNPSQYWNATNDPTTLESALSYIPETPWNNTCASPQVFHQLTVVDGLAEATPEAVCNDPKEQGGLLNTVGGSGGASNCATVDPSNSAQPCSGGHPKPAWQAGVPGIPGDQQRDLPDVSLMAGNALWRSAYVFCQSDAIGGPCDVNNAIEAAGGTSFASPIFAGMLALVEQKTGAPLGNANYMLYKLAAAQSANPAAASACQASNVITGNMCVFYDITEGSNAVPCLTGTPDCTPSVATDRFGVLSGYSAQPGYDLATGLGSVNATNLVNGWAPAAAAFVPTTTRITATGSTTVSYGMAVNASVSVAAVAPAMGTPSGDVGITSNSTTPNSISIGEGTLTSGTTTVAALPLPVGTYQLYAHYAGDATFAPSDGATGLTVTVSPAVTSGQLTASSNAVTAGQYVTLSLALPAVTGAAAPTGTATFVDNTNNTTLGSRLVISNTDNSASTATLTFAVSLLKPGVNVIVARYAGDAAYGSSSSATVSVTLTVPFTVSVNPGALTVTAGNKGSATVTATPVGKGGVLDPAALTFACPSTLAAGLTCSFSAPVAGANGTVSSTLSLQTSSPLLVRPTGSLASSSMDTSPTALLRSTGAVSLGCVLLCCGPRRRRKFLPLFLVVLLPFATLFVGCSNGASGSGSKALTSTTTVLKVNTVTPVLGAPEVLSATVSDASGSGTPTGTVTFSSGTGALGTGSLSNGTATYTTSALPIGAQSVTATYSGDSNYAASASASTSVDVQFTTTLGIMVSDQSGDSSTANLTLTVQ